MKKIYPENRNTEKRKAYLAIYRPAYRKNNKELIASRQRKYYLKLRLLALQAYSAELPFCACCGEKEIKFLAIDHIDGNGAKHRRELKLQGSRMTVWLMQKGYPEGFQVLCHNCNMAKGFYGSCPHKQKSELVV